MYIRITVCLFIVSSWYIKGSCGSEPCQPLETVKVIHACIDNTLSDLHEVYVSTRQAPRQQAVECSCTITPTGSLEQYSYTVDGVSAYHDDNTNFTFAFNDVIFKDSANFDDLIKINITGETVLKYSLLNDDTVQVCLYIAAFTDGDKFNITCTKQVIHQSTVTSTSLITTTSKAGSTQVTTTSKNDSFVNTEPITSSTSNSNIDTSKSDSNNEITESTKSTSVNTEPQTNNNTNEDKTILIAASGGGGGLALIIIIVIVIACCKRKRKSPPKEATSNEATSRADARPASFCDGSDDDDYGMVLNPSYQPFHEVLPNQPPQNTDTVETNLSTGDTSTSAPVYSTPIKRKVSQYTANDITTTVPSNDSTEKGVTRQPGDTNNPASHYHSLRHQAAQVVTSDIDDTYDHTFTSASGKWTGNEYNRVPMRRNEEQNVSDNDTYNVMKL